MKETLEELGVELGIEGYIRRGLNMMSKECLTRLKNVSGSSFSLLASSSSRAIFSEGGDVGSNKASEAVNSRVMRAHPIP